MDTSANASDPLESLRTLTLAEVEQRLTSLREQHEAAESILKKLRERLRQGKDQPTPCSASVPALAKPSSASLKPEDKVALFLRLFRGRNDVYPKLWQNLKTG